MISNNYKIMIKRLEHQLKPKHKILYNILSYIGKYYFGVLYALLTILLIVFPLMMVSRIGIYSIIYFVLSNIFWGLVFLVIYITCIFFFRQEKKSCINRETYNVFLKYMGKLILYTGALAAGFSSVVSFILMHSKNINIVLSRYAAEASHIVPDIFNSIIILLSLFNVVLFGKAINEINNKNSIEIGKLIYFILMVFITIWSALILDDWP